jgi:hypothetical protein
MGAFQIATTAGVAAAAIVGGILLLNNVLQANSEASQVASQSELEWKAKLEDANSRVLASELQLADAKGKGGQAGYDLRRDAELDLAKAIDDRHLAEVNVQAFEMQRHGELMQRLRAYSAEYVRDQELQATITSGSQAQIQATLAAVQASWEELSAKIKASAFSSDEEMVAAIQQADEYQNQINDLNAALGRVANDGLQKKAEAERKAAEAARLHESELQKLSGSLGRLGIDFRNVSSASLALVQGGSIGELAAQVSAANDAERTLARTILSSGNQALIDQMSIATAKGETMEQLADSLGLTAEQEEELRRQGRLTTEGLISQREAAAQAAGQPTATVVDTGLPGGPVIRAVAAAKGYDGMVSKPTLFLAGEAGPESVSITPRGQSPQGGPVSLVQNFYGPADPIAVRAAAQQGMTIVQRRVASRRSY